MLWGSVALRIWGSGTLTPVEWLWGSGTQGFGGSVFWGSGTSDFGVQRLSDSGVWWLWSSLTPCSVAQWLCPGFIPPGFAVPAPPGAHRSSPSPRSEGERPPPNEKKKEKGMKRGGNRFEPYANPAKRYRAFITNIPFDVKWQSLKDLVKEKGKVQLRCPSPCLALSVAQHLGALSHTRLAKLFSKPCWVLHNLGSLPGEDASCGGLWCAADRASARD